ncbi:hypothetical protein [Streptomyces sp. NPDC048187]|uniref:hypothetical protein n=1 Tax=Streptomyces sp. NPDC048187 TaxID=3365509 RepID=UPI0037152A4B
MASSTVTSAQPERPPRPNLAFRRLRGQRSPAEFAAAVRRAAREIDERVSCDARYVGRVEAGEIRCPNYAYERVFLHMFPGRTLTDLGFAPRSSVRGRQPRTTGESRGAGEPYETYDTRDTHDLYETHDNNEESDVLRRAFMTSGATVAAASLGPLGLALDAAAAGRPARRAGTSEAGALEEAVRRIRLLDDRHGADGLYRRAAAPLRTAYALLDAGASRQAVADRLYSGAGELAISVGWLAHDSGRFDDARSHYAEALATARTNDDPALEAHAFCNMAFLARDAGRPREAVRASQAAQRAARPLGSDRLMSLLALREAGGWAGLADRVGCEQALVRAQTFFQRGPSDTDPEWMSFYGEAELEGLEAQCWSTLGDWPRAARHARRAAELQDPHFTRNLALYTAELADDLARGGRPDEAAGAGTRVLDLLGEVQSSRVRTMLAGTARVLLPHRRAARVSTFLDRHGALPRPA